MNDASANADHKARAAIGPREFIAIVAALMTTNAMAIDIMLPALPAIGSALNVEADNQRQLVITLFTIAFGGAQLFYGPISDRFGRKPVLAASLVGYAACAALCAVAQSFVLLLVARTLQGVAAAGSRVLIASIVRDRFQGAAMARVMSFAMIVFLIVPVVAPSVGQAVLAVTDWRAIFVILTLYGLVVLAWASVRLPETLAPEARRPLTLIKVREAFALTLSHRASIGNTIATGLMFGALFGFINSIQQIVFDVFGRGELIGIVFAGIAGSMAISSYLNARIVERFGTRPIMLGGLIAFVSIAALHLALDFVSSDALLRFAIFQALSLTCYGLITSNLSATAMQPLGHIAGTASSVQGFITTLGGALIGLLIGQAFDGTTRPLVAGTFMLGLGALGFVLWANRPPVESKLSA